MANLTLVQAINLALIQEMEDDDRVILHLLGETLTAFETFEKFDGSNLDPMLQFDDADEIIDMVGKRGWELVTVERLNVGAEQQLRWYFKRPHR